jgi:hypothetical protein
MLYFRHLENDRRMIVDWIKLAHIPPGQPYAPSTGDSTTVRGAFVRVTNLMAAQDLLYGPINYLRLYWSIEDIDGHF